ncbi:MAG: hypothetical protein R2867_32450 [Caldilineaceae bacterium]
MEYADEVTPDSFGRLANITAKSFSILRCTILMRPRLDQANSSEQRRDGAHVDPVRARQNFATLDSISRGRAEMVKACSFIESFPPLAWTA